MSQVLVPITPQLLTLAVAKAHLNETSTDRDEEISFKLESARQIAAAHLCRNIYDDDEELAAEIALVPAELIAASSAYEAAYDAACLISDADIQAIEIAYAQDKYSRARFAASATRNGIAINQLIVAAILLILGDLMEHKESTVVGPSVSALPRGAYDILSLQRYYGN